MNSVGGGGSRWDYDDDDRFLYKLGSVIFFSSLVLVVVVSVCREMKEDYSRKVCGIRCCFQTSRLTTWTWLIPFSFYFSRPPLTRKKVGPPIGFAGLRYAFHYSFHPRLSKWPLLFVMNKKFVITRPKQPKKTSQKKLWFVIWF